MRAKLKLKGLKDTEVGKKQEGWTAVTQSTGTLIYSHNTAELRGEAGMGKIVILPAISWDTVGCISK